MEFIKVIYLNKQKTPQTMMTAITIEIKID